MKNLKSTLRQPFMLLGAAFVLGLSVPALAAVEATSGHVDTVFGQNATICQVAQAATGNASAACTVEEAAGGIVVVKGDRVPEVAPGQSVVIEVTGEHGGKVMAKVVGVLTKGAETGVQEIATRMKAEGSNLLWRGAEKDGEILLLKTEKTLAVSSGDAVSLKLKKAKRGPAVEGC